MEKRLNKIALCFLLPLLLFSSCEEKPEVIYSKLDGLYNCTEQSSMYGVKKYFIEIDKTISHDNRYIISNFHNQGDVNWVYTELLMDSLIIPNQSFGTMIISGKGTVNSDFNNIYMYYKIDDGLYEIDYYCTYSR